MEHYVWNRNNLGNYFIVSTLLEKEIFVQQENYCWNKNDSFSINVYKHKKIKWRYSIITYGWEKN